MDQPGQEQKRMIKLTTVAGDYDDEYELIRQIEL